MSRRRNVLNGFFFSSRRRHTRFDCDWSSDVCSSDLDVEFGNEGVRFPSTDVLIDWYDYLFKGVQNEFATDRPARVFVMGANAYHQESDWPPPEAQSTRYFLHSGGSANSLRGDGGLSLTPPRKETPDKFTYDPANAVPTVGGSLCCDAAHYEPGPRDQRTIENRNEDRKSTRLNSSHSQISY